MSDRNYSYELSLNILKALGGDMTVQYEDADQIWAAIDEIYAASGDGIDLQELALEITENGTYDYNKTDKIDAYVPVNIKVNVHQKYTDEQVEALKEESRQQGYDLGVADGYVQGETAGYTDGYSEGLEDGAEDQKALLEEITITKNGVYEKEDGYNKVNVEVPTEGGGSGFDFSVLGFSSDVNNKLNAGIQADIDYSKSIKDNWNPNTTSTYQKFQYDKIKYMPNVDTSKVTNMSYMFNGSGITYIDLLDTSKVTNMNSMFRDCSNLNSVPLFDTSKVTNMNSMFYNCTSLTTVSLFDTSNVTNMDSMFYNTQLESVPAFNTQKVTTFSRCFEILKNKLTSFPALDCSSCTTISYLFGISNSNHTNLTDLGGFINLGCKSSLSGTTDSYFLKKVPNLTHESVMNVINNLYDRASAGYSVLKLVMHANHLALLTDEEKAIATNKGWTLA